MQESDKSRGSVLEDGFWSISYLLIFSGIAFAIHHDKTTKAGVDMLVGVGLAQAILLSVLPANRNRLGLVVHVGACLTFAALDVVALALIL